MPFIPAENVLRYPATDYIVVSNNKSAMTTGPLTFQLYDALGRLLLEESMACLPHHIELADLPAAGYFYRVFQAAGQSLGEGTLIRMYKG